MTVASHTKRNSSVPKKRRTVTINFIPTIADTTWRMFLPAGIGVALGLWGDTSIVHTTPILTLAGMVLGLAAGGYLVHLQLKRLAS